LGSIVDGSQGVDVGDSEGDEGDEMTERMFRDEECLPKYFKDDTETKTKIVVPEGMLGAVLGNDLHALYTVNLVTTMIERALRWLSENPIEPTPGFGSRFMRTLGGYHETEKLVEWGAAEWQRRMFLAPEPEVPEELKDLLEGMKSMPTLEREWATRVALESYRRGKDGRI
jgi:hypothetical protein